MNHFKHLGFIALAGLALAGCAEEELAQGGGQGRLRVEVDVNPSLLTSRSARAASTDGVVSIDANELMLQLTSADGEWSKSWESVDELNADGEVPSGTYKMEAFYGSPYAQGFESPYFYGEADVTVRTGETTEAGLTASLANAMMTITYGQSMAGYLSAYNAELQCAGAQDIIEYTQDETRPAYVRTGEVAVYVNVTKPSGASARLLAGTVTAQARHHYFLNVDMNEGAGAGEAQLVVTFDDDLVADEYVIDLSDELLDAPAPTVTAVGFADAVVKHYDHTPYLADLRYDIYAPGQIGKVILNTTNAQAINEMWPEQVDLMAIPASLQQAVAGFGLGVRGLWQEPGSTLACIDFAGLLKNISVPDGQDEVNLAFSLTVVDKYGKASEPAQTLSVRIEPKYGANVSDAWASRAYFTVYDLQDNTIKYTEGVTAEVSTDGVTFTPAPVEAQPDGQLLVTGLEPSTAYTMRAFVNGSATGRINFTTEPANQLPNSGMEDWHTVGGKTNYWWVEYPWAEGDTIPAWNTLNQLTTSEGGSSTSAFNSNRDGCSYNAYSGTRVTTDSHDGRAAIIETVGWGRGNSATGTSSTAKYRTAGELYLGSYDESAKAGNYGLAFETRPLSLEFWYKYTPKNPADFGTAVMEVLNENGEVIGSTGVVALTAQSAYTLKSAPITYTDVHSKAKQVKVVFKSTVGNDGTHDFIERNADNFNFPAFGNTSNGRIVGSSLYIDDINLVY